MGINRPQITKLSEAFDSAAARKKLSQTTIRRYRVAIREFLVFVKVHKQEIEPTCVAMFLRQFNNSPSKFGLYFYALKFFFEEVCKKRLKIRLADLTPQTKKPTLIKLLLRPIRWITSAKRSW
jgi:hypothetical protein